MAKEDECCYCKRMWIITILEGKELKDTVNEGHNDSECEKGKDSSPGKFAATEYT